MVGARGFAKLVLQNKAYEPDGKDSYDDRWMRVRMPRGNR